MMGFTDVQPILRAVRQPLRCGFHLFEPKKAGRFELAALVQQLAVGHDIIWHRAGAPMIGRCGCGRVSAVPIMH
jgi:hypothetical protein